MNEASAVQRIVKGIVSLIITEKHSKLFIFLLALLFLFPLFAMVNDSHAATPQIAAGVNYTVALKSDGTLWAWGHNYYGELGLGDTTDRYSPVKVGSDTNWVSISAGDYHTVALKSDGTLWAWGYNWDGELGLGDTTERDSPIQVGSDTNWVSISAGGLHTIALKSDGTLWAWGYNGDGRLGLGDTTDRHSPVRVGSDYNWVSISTGGYHTTALKSDGTLWVWGGNSSGQLGLGDVTDRHSPVQVGSDTNWVSISAKYYYHTLALKSNGTLWAWGWNGDGRLGDGSTGEKNSPVQIGSDNKWVSIAGGATHTVALKSDGSLWSWGLNEYGQLGLGDPFERHVPMITSIATNWVSIAAGAEHTLALKSDGTLWAWGYNGDGDLGLGDTTDRPSPAQVGSDNKWVSIAAEYYDTIALKSNGTLWAWGNNNIAQLGLGDTTDRPSPVQVGSDNKWVSIATGADHTIALKSDGTLWAWGGNASGQLGYTSADTCGLAGPCTKSPTQVGSDTDWVSIATGAYHTIALKSDGTLWAWGRNLAGSLGLGDTTNRPSPVQVGSDNQWVSITAGNAHTMALKSDGTLWAWGGNGDGQLGLGDIAQRLSPVQVGSDNKWVLIAAGWDHTIALKSDGTLWAWGYNGSGQLGLGDTDTTDRLSPVQVGSDNKWASISAGGMHTIALKSDGTLWAWGDNFFGQLGDGTTLTYRYSPELIGVFCTYSINPVKLFAPSIAVIGYTVSVTASDNSCTWIAKDYPAWITITGGLSGMGNGTVTFNVGPNTAPLSPPRDGRITIAGQSFTVTQSSQTIQEQITQQNITVSGPGPILVKTRFMNNSANGIYTIKPDCYNTYFWLTDSSGNVVPRWCVIGPPYGIPNDVVYIPPYGSYPPSSSGPLTCDISNRYPDLAPGDYSAIATYANYIKDPDYDPNTGTCSNNSDRTDCHDLWNGAAASGKASLTVPLYVTEPNGGEVIPSGGNWAICWEAPSNAVKFDLMYSTNNGTSWNFIKNVTGLDCTKWEVPVVALDKKKCRVKVIGYDSANVNLGGDISDKPFTIAVVTVISPNGEETVTSGGTWTIRWHTNKTIRPVAKTILKYTTDGTTWKSITALSDNPEFYLWTVPNVSSSKCKVKVVLKDSSGVIIGTDISDKFFTIQP